MKESILSFEKNQVKDLLKLLWLEEELIYTWALV